MGSSEIFDEAIGEFAVEYTDQNESDYKRFVNAIREGKIEVIADAWSGNLFRATIWRGVGRRPLLCAASKVGCGARAEVQAGCAGGWN
jgi:Uncharacterized protein conserved in bacteria (DUF2252)